MVYDCGAPDLYKLAHMYTAVVKSSGIPVLLVGNKVDLATNADGYLEALAPFKDWSDDIAHALCSTKVL